MGSLGPTHLIALILAVALTAWITGFVAAAATHRKKRHARRFMALGFVCGLMAGATLRGRRRGLALLGLMGDRRAISATGLVTRLARSLPQRR
jgi:hypothetical protein